MVLAQRRKLADRRKRYQNRRREADPGAFASARRRQHRAQREKMLAFLGGRCPGCGHTDPRALVVVQVDGQRLDWGALYTLMLAEPDEFRGIASLTCANCRMIQRYH